LKNSGVPIAKEGLPFLFVCLIATLGFVVGDIWPLAIVFAILSAFMAFFFRNPERLPPVGGRTVASPADGKIIFIGETKEPDFLGQPLKRVSIFLSIFDVHLNRFPIDGTVKNIKYHRGRFMAAFEERASEENERNALLIETNDHQKMVVVQVAGLIARRIVCYPTIGDFVMKGQRFGLIRFGSRTDLYLPLSADLLVKEGDRVFGGETVIAHLAEAQEPEGDAQ